MASLSVNEQTDGSTPQETCILILFETYILHRQGPGFNSIRKISTIFSYMIFFHCLQKILQKVTFKRCLQFITQFQLKISHALRFLSNQENVYCAFSCDLDYHGYGFQVCPNMTIGECFNATSFK